MEALTSKGKHTLKVGNTHTQISHHNRKMRRAQKQGTGKDQQLKSILFIYKLLYQNLMVTAKQKSTIDTHTKIKRIPNTTLKLIIKSQKKRITYNPDYCAQQGSHSDMKENSKVLQASKS